MKTVNYFNVMYIWRMCVMFYVLPRQVSNKTDDLIFGPPNIVPLFPKFFVSSLVIITCTSLLAPSE